MSPKKLKKTEKIWLYRIAIFKQQQTMLGGVELLYCQQFELNQVQHQFTLNQINLINYNPFAKTACWRLNLYKINTRRLVFHL